MEKPINESVKHVLRDEGWSSGHTILEASLDRIMTHITGKGEDRKTDDKGRAQVKPDAHFAILSSYRKFHAPHEDPRVQAKDKKLQGELARYSREEGKEHLPKHLHDLKSPHEVEGGDPSHGTRRFNETGFQRMIRDIKNRGLGAIRTSGLWAEGRKGGDVDPFERSVFIPGKPRRSVDEPGTHRREPESPLTLDWVKALGKKYNQQSIIYMGPDGRKGEVGLYEIDMDSGVYVDLFGWNMLGLKTPEQIQAGLDRMRSLAKKHAEEGGKPPEDFTSATVPRGSGKATTFEPVAGVEDKGGQRTRRPGFAFENEHGTLTFWLELIMEKGSVSDRGRVLATLDNDPFYTGPAPAGGLVF